MAAPARKLFTKQGIIPQPQTPCTPSSWLILTENLEKSHKLHALFPKSEILSTAGVPFDIELDTQNPTLSYTIGFLTPKAREFEELLRTKADTARFIILIFEPGNKGQTIAHNLITHFPELEDKWIYPDTHSLEENYLKKAIETQISLEPRHRARPCPHTATAHWTQAAMDLAWTKKINPWVKKAFELVSSQGENTHATPQSLSRLQCALLNTIAELTAQKSHQPRFPRWEVHATLISSVPGIRFQAAISVPSLLLLKSPLTAHIWEKKLNNHHLASLLGRSPTPLTPGTPWAFERHEEATLYKRHLQRFPFLTIEHTEIINAPAHCPPAHNITSLLDRALCQNLGSLKDITHTLSELYQEGLISYPKTTATHIPKERYAKIASLLLANKHNVKPCSELSFPGAIVPTDWELPPAMAQQAINARISPKRATIAHALYSEIYARAINSLVEHPPQPTLQIWAVGPLPITIAKAAQGIPVPKESPIESQMNAVFCARIPYDPNREIPPVNSLLQATLITLHKYNPPAEEKVTQRELVLLMQENHLGKPDTLLNHLNSMRNLGLLTFPSPCEVALTPAGSLTLRLLNEYLGQFIHMPYHHAMTRQIQNIRQNAQNAKDFLNYWWSTLCELADTLPPIPKPSDQDAAKAFTNLEHTVQPQSSTLDAVKIPA